MMILRTEPQYWIAGALRAGAGGGGGGALTSLLSLHIVTRHHVKKSCDYYKKEEKKERRKKKKKKKKIGGLSHYTQKSETRMIASILNNLAQPKTNKWLSSPSNF